MKRIKKIIVILLLILFTMMQIMNHNSYAETSEEKAQAMYNYIYDACDSALSVINQGWILNLKNILNTDNILSYKMDAGLTLSSELYNATKQIAKDDGWAKEDIANYIEEIENAKTELEDNKRNLFGSASLSNVSYEGINLGKAYNNAVAIMTRVITSIKTVQNQTSSGGSISGGTIGGSSKTLEETINDADSFLNQGNSGVLNQGRMNQASELIYNTLLVIGLIIAVIMGFVISIKFMAGSVEEKADVKKVLITYVVGCIVIFGAFLIWKIVLNIGNSAMP